MASEPQSQNPLFPDEEPKKEGNGSVEDAPALLDESVKVAKKRAKRELRDDERDYLTEAANALTVSLPFSTDAERSLLSCLIQAPHQLIDEVVTKISPDAFYIPSHRVIYDLLLELNDSSEPIDPRTVTEALLNKRKVNAAGGPAAILELLEYTPSVSRAHFDFWVSQVHDKHTLRKMIEACSEVIAKAFESQEGVAVQVDQAEQRILGVREEQEGGREEKSLREQVMEVLDEIEQAATNPDAIRGVFTGFSQLDAMTKGLSGGDIFVIAARPSMGKTALVMNMVEHVAINLKTPVAVFSLEMSSNSLVRRLLSTRSEIPMSKLKDGLFTPDDYNRLIAAAGDLKEANIVIDDTPSLSIIELRAKARRFKKQHDIGLIAIDYLQLCRSTSSRGQDNRQIEIAEISAGLKALAKELDIPIIVLAQLNRQVEQRKGGRPMLSDLRESGSIEQDADMVGLLTRNDYAGSKGGDGEKDEEEEMDESKKGDSLLIIAKHRNGETGDVLLKFIDSQMRFVDREPPKDDDLST